MRAVLGFVTMVLALGIGLFVYRSYLGQGVRTAEMGTNNVRAAVDVTGVRSDLLAMARAERARLALDGKYVPLEDLAATGDIAINPARGRSGYSYSASMSDSHFTITAEYSGPAAGMPSMAIDETLTIRTR